MKAKEILYRSLFLLFALIMSLLLHALIEWPVLTFITSDFERHSQSLIWQHWELIHRTFSIVLWALGAGLGYYYGRYFWYVLYVQPRQTR